MHRGYSRYVVPGIIVFEGDVCARYSTWLQEESIVTGGSTPPCLFVSIYFMVAVSINYYIIYVYSSLYIFHGCN